MREFKIELFAKCLDQVGTGLVQSSANCQQKLCQAAKSYQSITSIISPRKVGADIHQAFQSHFYLLVHLILRKWQIEENLLNLSPE